MTLYVQGSVVEELPGICEAGSGCVEGKGGEKNLGKDQHLDKNPCGSHRSCCRDRLLMGASYSKYRIIVGVGISSGHTRQVREQSESSARE